MKACFFDLDGTLLDTLADIGGACNAVLAAHGYPVHPVGAYRQMVGNGFPILMRRALPESVVAQGPQERLDALTEEGRAYYAAHLSIHTTPYPGLAAALARLQDAGLRLAVLSNKPEDLTCALVPLHFPGIRFDAVRGGYSVRDIERAVKLALNPPPEKPKKQEMSLELNDLVERFRGTFKTKVSLIGNDNKGRITIDYYTRDDLDRISDLLDELNREH